MMKKTTMLKVLPIAIGAILLTGCGKSAADKSEKTTIHVSAAASLKDSMTDIKAKFEKKNANIKVDIDYAGSGQIVQRVKSGAPVDGVLLASEADSSALTKAKLASDQTKFAGNELVIVANKKAKVDTLTASQVKSYLKGTDKIAIGNVDSVPAGEYAKQSLTNLNLYTALKNQYVGAQDVRQVLSYVESGNAQAGFVYQTDAKISKKVKVIYKVPAKLHDAIGYYSDVVNDSKVKDETNKFLAYLQTDTAEKILAGYGFKI